MIGMPDLFDLRRLIDPVSPETFVSEFYEQKPLLVQRETPDYFMPLLSFEEIDRVLTTLSLHYPDVDMVNAKKRLKVGDFTYPSGLVDPAKLYQEFADGASVVLPSLDAVVPQLAQLCRAMEREMSARFQTNIYMTPGKQSQGFVSHYASHDVFVLQVAGSKHWKVYDTPVELPFRNMSFDPALTQPKDVTMEFDLQPGDTFYIPRGVMHDASTNEGGSLHITLGVLHTSWTDFLAEALARVGLEDSAFRRGLPAGFARAGFDRSAARATFRDLLQRFVDAADFDGTFEHFAGDLISSRHALLQGQMQQIMKLDTLGLDSRMGARPNLLFDIREDEERVRLTCHGNTLSLPAHAAEPLRFAVEAPEYRVRDLPGDLDDEGKRVLVSRLVREGLVRFL